jgi:hypothetical protein
MRGELAATPSMLEELVTSPQEELHDVYMIMCVPFPYTIY